MLLPLRERLDVLPPRREAVLRLLVVPPLLRLPPRPLLERLLLLDLLPIPELLDDPRLFAMATPYEKGDWLGPLLQLPDRLRTSEENQLKSRAAERSVRQEVTTALPVM
jgi:hypothetical protein